MRDLRPGEAVLWGIVVAFVGYELVAHFTHYRYGRTLSRIVTQAEHSRIVAVAVAVRLLVVCALVALGVHLEGAY